VKTRVFSCFQVFVTKKLRRVFLLTSICTASLFVWPAIALALALTNAGVPVSPYPTVNNLSIEWPISDDDNLNGVVNVRYRKNGSVTWQTGFSLRRIPAGSNVGFSWANKHSGSIFGLLPNTNYEIELTLTDPDGGSTAATLNASTRAVPFIPSNANIVSVNPGNFSSAASSASPNTVLLMADGNYSGFTVSVSGTSTAPIVFKAENPGFAVINGDVRIDGRSYVFIEGLSVNGKIKFNNAEGIVVRGSTVVTPDSGIVSLGNGVINAYITDNVVIGPTGWANSTVGASGNNLGEGIQLTGPGNIIAYNYVKGFRDAISTLEGSSAVNQVSIDIYNNDIEIGADDAIEADFTMGNARVIENRISNSFVGISGQPTLGGPAYYIRNVMHNIIYSPFKLHRGSIGDIALHNTIVKSGDAFAVYTGSTWSRAFFRNNLFIGGTGGGSYGGYSNGSGRIAQLGSADASCDFDYDGWASIGTGSFSGNISGNSFSSLAGMQSNTTETNAIQVDMSIFAASVPFPASGPFPAFPIVDMRLASGSVAEDSGQVLANINDGYAGAAPDLGAYEAGDTLPIYGPRPGRHPGYVSTDTMAPAAPTNLQIQ